VTDTTGEASSGPLLGALAELRSVVRAAPLRLGLPDAVLGTHVREELLATLDDHVLARLNKPGGPVLVVVAGPTGAGKSTLVNSLVRAPVSRTGVVRPTTRAPVLVCNPADEGWYLSGRPLSGLRPVREDTAEAGTVQIVSIATVPAGVAVVDAPDVDSVAADDRELATRLLAAADVWLFVLTANRYADAVPWQHLLTARDRGAVLVVVLDRVPPYASAEVHAHLSEMLVYAGLGQAPVFTVSETTLNDGLLDEFDVVTLRDWLQRVAVDPTIREAIVARTFSGSLRALPGRARALAAVVAEHQQVARVLGEDLAGAFAGARGDLAAGLASGVIVTGDLLRRWQEYVGAGGLDGLTTPVRKGLFRRRAHSPGAAALGDALEDALAVYVGVLAARALDQLRDVWPTRIGGADAVAAVDWVPRTDLSGAAVEVLRGWAGSGGPVLSLLAVGAAASSALVGDETVRVVSEDGGYARRVEVLRTELVARLGAILVAERDALALEAGLTVFAGAELAVLRAADALERVLS
jgi:energy-coupling factor transporter ATP-binding protein EcfA2